MSQRRAWMRAVPDSFVDALTAPDGGRPTLDVAEARRQHAAYRALLTSAGYDVTVVDADERHPDCPFIEDTVVLLGGLAVITRPGAPSRRGETDAVRAVFAAHHALREIHEPGTLDGGDVLLIGDTAYVGRSRRTNDAAIAQLGAIASEFGKTVTPVDVGGGFLHLKSAAAALDDHTVLVHEGGADPASFAGIDVIPAPLTRTRHGSVLRLGNGRLAVTAFPAATAELLSDRGYDVVVIDVSQFQAADGGLTCLSVLEWGLV